MSKATYRTANGKMVAMETLRLENEKTIAVGNMKVNARGDSLGPGGAVVSTKQQAVTQYYNLHTPTAGSNEPSPVVPQHNAVSADPLIDEQDMFTHEEAVVEQKQVPHHVPAAAGQKPVRGSLAASVAQKPIDVKQELMKTAKQQVKSKGPARF